MLIDAGDGGYGGNGTGFNSEKRRNGGFFFVLEISESPFL